MKNKRHIRPNSYIQNYENYKCTPDHIGFVLYFLGFDISCGVFVIKLASMLPHSILTFFTSWRIIIYYKTNMLSFTNIVDIVFAVLRLLLSIGFCIGPFTFPYEPQLSRFHTVVTPLDIFDFFFKSLQYSTLVHCFLLFLLDEPKFAFTLLLLIIGNEWYQQNYEGHYNTARNLARKRLKIEKGKKILRYLAKTGVDAIVGLLFYFACFILFSSALISLADIPPALNNIFIHSTSKSSLFYTVLSSILHLVQILILLFFLFVLVTPERKPRNREITSKEYDDASGIIYAVLFFASCGTVLLISSLHGIYLVYHVMQVQS